MKSKAINGMIASATGIAMSVAGYASTSPGAPTRFLPQPPPFSTSNAPVIELDQNAPGNVDLNIDESGNSRCSGAFTISLPSCKVMRYNDDSYLRFFKPLTVDMFYNGKIRIKDWGDTVIQSSGPMEIRKSIIKYVHDMYCKALSQTLTKQEKKIWLRMLDSFDYDSFIHENSPIKYEQGKVVSLNKKTAILRMSGNDRQVVSIQLSVCFTNGMLKAGDHFGAMVKRGRQDNIVSINEISVLPEIPETINLSNIQKYEFKRVSD